MFFVFHTDEMRPCYMHPDMYLWCYTCDKIDRNCWIVLLMFLSVVWFKVRTAFIGSRSRANYIVSDIYEWGASAITIHGWSWQQRYSKLFDWDYIYQCAQKTPDNLHIVGNSDVFSFTDWNKHVSDCSKISTCMIARGALIKVLILYCTCFCIYMKIMTASLIPSTFSSLMMWLMLTSFQYPFTFVGTHIEIILN